MNWLAYGLPSIAVPLGTYTGWCLRGSDKPAAGTLERWAGSRWPFSMTIEERKSKGDPRPSIEELYPTHTDYLSKVVSVVLKLKSEHFLLDEDAVLPATGGCPSRFHCAD